MVAGAREGVGEKKEEGKGGVAKDHGGHNLQPRGSGYRG
jgi:hypothetical protein